MEWPERIIVGILLFFTGALMLLATQHEFLGFISGWIIISLGIMVGTGLYQWLEEKREERQEKKHKK